MTYGSDTSIASSKKPSSKPRKQSRGSNDESGSDLEEDAEDKEPEEQQTALDVSSDALAGGTINLAAAEQLKWRDVSSEGHIMGPSAFRMPGLVPGSSYIFRAMVRNEYGWSPMSAASPIITTFPCTPPGRPVALDINSGFFYLQWNESDGEALGLTNLDFQVQIGKIPLGEKARANTLAWALADTRTAPHLCAKPFVGVMVDKLSSSSVFACRVRSRTIAGWSDWSEISDPIRTKAV